jgi:hypothetical protein
MLPPSKRNLPKETNMGDQSDRLVVTTVAKVAREFSARGTGGEAGIAFERAVYNAMLRADTWRHHAGPDEFDMGGLLRSRTGIHYEFDSAFLGTDTLYVIEAKRHARITRQHLSEFAAKLLDVVLGSADQIGAFAVKPVFVSGLPHIDANAWHYAVSWGILLISPSRPTPWELLDLLSVHDAAVHLTAECEALCGQLLRSLTATITLADSHTARFSVAANAIYGAQQVSSVLESWRECQRAAASWTNTRRTG